MSNIKLKDILNEANTSGDSKYFNNYEAWNTFKMINMYNARTGRVEDAVIRKVKSSSLIAQNNHGISIEVKFKDIDIGKNPCTDCDDPSIPTVMSIKPSPKEIKAIANLIKATGKDIEKIMDKAMKDIDKITVVESPILNKENIVHAMSNIVTAYYKKTGGK